MSGPLGGGFFLIHTVDIFVSVIVILQCYHAVVFCCV